MRRTNTVPPRRSPIMQPKNSVGYARNWSARYRRAWSDSTRVRASVASAPRGCAGAACSATTARRPAAGRAARATRVSSDSPVPTVLPRSDGRRDVEGPRHVAVHEPAGLLNPCALHPAVRDDPAQPRGARLPVHHALELGGERPRGGIGSDSPPGPHVPDGVGGLDRTLHLVKE